MTISTGTVCPAAHTQVFSIALCGICTFVALLALLRRAFGCHAPGERDRKEVDNPDYEWRNAWASTTFTSV